MMRPLDTTTAQTLCPDKSCCVQIPSSDQVHALSAELRERSKLPAHIPKVLAAMAPDTHPMVQFSTAVNCLQVLACSHKWLPGCV